jgi:hypothetical protein
MVRLPMTEKKYTAIFESNEVTEEILDAARSIVDGWYANRHIDLNDFLDRLETYQLANGTYPDFGTDITTPAIQKILRYMRRYKMGN